jgi:hypothetical protein
VPVVPVASTRLFVTVAAAAVERPGGDADATEVGLDRFVVFVAQVEHDLYAIDTTVDAVLPFGITSRVLAGPRVTHGRAAHRTSRNRRRHAERGRCDRHPAPGR